MAPTTHSLVLLLLVLTATSLASNSKGIAAAKVVTVTTWTQLYNALRNPGDGDALYLPPGTNILQKVGDPSLPNIKVKITIRVDSSPGHRYVSITGDSSSGAIFVVNGGSLDIVDVAGTPSCTRTHFSPYLTLRGGYSPSDGGAIRIHSGSCPLGCSFNSVRIRNNYAVNRGGGMYIGNNIKVSLRCVAIHYNWADTGGGVYLGQGSTLTFGKHGVTPTNSVVFGNQAFLNTPPAGGAIHVYRDSKVEAFEPVMFGFPVGEDPGVTIEVNLPTSIFLGPGSTLWCNNNVQFISSAVMRAGKNTPNGNVGEPPEAVQLSAGLRIATSIYGCSAVVLNAANSRTAVVRSWIEAVTMWGVLPDKSALYLPDGVFLDYRTSATGFAGLNAKSLSVTFDSSSGNKGATIDGAAKARIFKVGTGRSLNFIDLNPSPKCGGQYGHTPYLHIKGGKASNDGGAIYYGAGSCPPPAGCTVQSVNFASNQATLTGGALFLGQNTKVTLKCVTFVSNKADRGGGAYLDSHSSCQMSSPGGAAFASNVATTAGGGLYLSPGVDVKALARSWFGSIASWSYAVPKVGVDTKDGVFVAKGSVLDCNSLITFVSRVTAGPHSNCGGMSPSPLTCTWVVDNNGAKPEYVALGTGATKPTVLKNCVGVKP